MSGNVQRRWEFKIVSFRYLVMNSCKLVNCKTSFDDECVTYESLKIYHDINSFNKLFHLLLQDFRKARGNPREKWEDFLKLERKFLNLRENSGKIERNWEIFRFSLQVRMSFPKKLSEDTKLSVDFATWSFVRLKAHWTWKSSKRNLNYLKFDFFPKNIHKSTLKILNCLLSSRII